MPAVLGIFSGTRQEMRKGYLCMSSADSAFIRTCKEILEKGTFVADEKTRPHWSDGSLAYTKKLFGVVNR